jgi:hypothetical protein
MGLGEKRRACLVSLSRSRKILTVVEKRNLIIHRVKQ